MRTPIDRGLTAPPAYTPFGGYARLDRLVKGLDSADRRSVAWACALSAVSIGTFAALWLDGYRLPHLWALFVLGAIAAAAERQTVAINDRTEMSVAFLPLVFSAVAFGPLGGFAVGALSTALDLRKSPLKWSVYTPIRGLTAAAAGLAVAKLVPHPDHLGQYLLASLVGSLVFLAADGFFSTATAFVRGNDPLAHLQAIASLAWLTVPLYVPVLTLFVYAYHTYSLELVLVFFVPTLALQRLLHLYRQEREATHRLGAANASPGRWLSLGDGLFPGQRHDCGRDL